MRNPTRWKLRAGHAQVAAFNFHISQEEGGRRATLFCSTLFPSGSLMTRANRPWNDLRNFRNDVGTTRRFVEGNDVVITAPIAASIVSRGTLHRLIIPLFYY